MDQACHQSFFSCSLWRESSLLAKIPPDLYPTIYYYADLQPAIKERYSLKFSFGSAGKERGRFNNPKAVTLDKNGAIYVADTDNHRIQVFQTDGTFMRTFGWRGSTNDGMSAPYALVFLPDERLVIAERGNRRVQIWDPIQGTFILLLRFVAEKNNQNSDPFGVAVDFYGSILVSEWSANQIRVYSPQTGQCIQKIGPIIDSGMISRPLGIAVSRAGTIILVDSGNHRLSIFKKTGEQASPFEQRFVYPTGVAVDRFSNVMVTDDNQIKIYSAKGSLWMSLGQPETTDDASLMDDPRTPVLTKNGDIIVADYGHNRICIWG